MNRLIAVLLCLAGVVFWFIKAPDPRFGYGFLLPFAALLFPLIVPAERLSFIKRSTLLLATGMLSAGVLSYTTYRCIYFLDKKNILFPAGVATPPYKTIECNSVMINVPLDGYDCGSTGIPCTTTPCDQFEPRGKSITDGFKAK